ncbi:MAG: peptidylprolyl isomerase [Chitinophagales bacterium]
MTTILKDPLLHFLLLGGLLFALYGFLNRNEEQSGDYQIIIEASDVDRLAKSYQQNWNYPPDSVTLQSLIEAEIKAEIFYREALRMNLDRNDEIIRRRLKQKYEFLVKDLTTPQRASDDLLLQFYEAHPNNYQSPKKISFHQFYFNPDLREKPLENAQNALKVLLNQSFEGGGKAQIGDKSHLQSYFAAKDADDVRQILGQEFTQTLFTAKEVGWMEPIQSGYGIHLVYIAAIETTDLQPFEMVKSQVLEDWKMAEQFKYQEDLFQNLRKKYQVTYNLVK